MSETGICDIETVSRETRERLDIYARRLKAWNNAINLVSRSTLSDLWVRHIVDSAQLVNLSQNPRNWIDLGSGAGLPGLIVAAVLVEKLPSFHLTCVESDRRKSIFIIETSRAMGLNVTVINRRIETLSGLRYDVVSARALASLTNLLEYSEPLCAPGGQCLFLKGEAIDDELTSARPHWHMDAEKIPSLTDPKACVLRVKEFSRVVS